MDSTQHIQQVPDWGWPAKRHGELEARAAAIAAEPWLPTVLLERELEEVERSAGTPAPPFVMGGAACV